MHYVNRFLPLISFIQRAKPLGSVVAALLSSLVVLATAGCAHNPDGAAAMAEKAALEGRVVRGLAFHHQVFESGLTQDVRELRIYIEGDGTPWMHGGRRPSRDPTPRRALAMSLMLRDDAPSIYLGRPCYFGLASLPECSSIVWTQQRYSQAVVDSMARVIEEYRDRHTPSRLVLVGYSGGGALATLLGRMLGPDDLLVTIAANLDTQAWTQSRGFLPLDGSLNPATFVAELKQLDQWHLQGALDTVVPPASTVAYTGELKAQQVEVWEDFDHTCCWEKMWPEALLRIAF